MEALPDYPVDVDERVDALLAEVTEAAAYRRVLCVKLAREGRTAAAIGAIVGLHPNSVQRLGARYRREGEGALWGQPLGGRHHAYLTVAEEDTLLAPFLAAAEAGGVLVAGPIKAAYEAQIGKAVPKSTIYRLLARHGWRKVAPRRRHPDQADGVREAFKKSSPSWWWTRSPIKQRPVLTAGRSG